MENYFRGNLLSRKFVLIAEKFQNVKTNKYSFCRNKFSCIDDGSNLRKSTFAYINFFLNINE